MNRILAISFLICSCLLGIGQGKILKYDYQLIVDNDAFTGDLTQDQYYSSGIYASFRQLKDSSEKAKIIRSYQLNHQMYTSSLISEDIIGFMDRPYAGVVAFTLANEYYFFNGHFFKAQLALGWMGPKAKVGEAQKTWHHFFGMEKPRGWKYQIEDSPMINLNLTHIHPYYTNGSIEFAGETNLQLGTVYDNARYDFIMRLGRLKPMNESAFVSSSLGNRRGNDPEKKTVESYFFYSPGVEYVLYNATLEGNLIGEKSIYTVDATKVIWQHRVGAMWSWSVFDLGIIAYWRRKANPEATNHNYVGIRLNQRF